MVFYLAVNPNKMGLCFHEDFIYYVYESVFLMETTGDVDNFRF